jgi:hypothetical protein
MRKPPPIELGQHFASTDDKRIAWRVSKLLNDHTHVVLIGRDDPSRRKTISVWALANQRLFVPFADTAK